MRGIFPTRTICVATKLYWVTFHSYQVKLQDLEEKARARHQQHNQRQRPLAAPQRPIGSPASSVERKKRSGAISDDESMVGGVSLVPCLADVSEPFWPTSRQVGAHFHRRGPPGVTFTGRSPPVKVTMDDGKSWEWELASALMTELAGAGGGGGLAEYQGGVCVVDGCVYLRRREFLQMLGNQQ